MWWEPFNKVPVMILIAVAVFIVADHVQKAIHRRRVKHAGVVKRVLDSFDE